MKKKVSYQKWIPLESVPERLWCEAIHDDYEGFRILLRRKKNDSPMLRVTFEAVIAYRNIDEGSLLRTWDLVADRDKFPFYIVKNSPWTEWFHEESYGIYKDRRITHYAIVTSDDCIDVLSEFEPKIEWLTHF